MCVPQSGGGRGRQGAFHFLQLFKTLRGRIRATGRDSKWQKHQVFSVNAYLDAEVPSVHVVAEEQIAGGAGGSAHLEKLHQVKELAVNVTTHWTQTHTCVGNIDSYFESLPFFLTFHKSSKVYVCVCVCEKEREGETP